LRPGFFSFNSLILCGIFLAAAYQSHNSSTTVINPVTGQAVVCAHLSRKNEPFACVAALYGNKRQICNLDRWDIEGPPIMVFILDERVCETLMSKKT